MYVSIYVCTHGWDGGQCTTGTDVCVCVCVCVRERERERERERVSE